MSYQRPELGPYTRKSDGADVLVLGSTGSEWNDSVLCSRTTEDGKRTWHVRLENFWKKYEPKGDAT
jgi:hypothetical protein